MKVIKHGEVTKEATCGYCGAVLAYTSDDVETIRLYNLLHIQVGEDKYITCPDCNNKIALSQTK